jgi:DNA-binding MarR family transcriptional regulator
LNQPSPDTDLLLTQAAEALFRFGRLFSKIDIAPLAAGRTPQAVELSRILIVQAIEALQGSAEQDITVGRIAQQLAVEPSTASRLVADAIGDGYLLRSVSPEDKRRVQLELSERGRALAKDVRAYQLAVFHHVTATWVDDERAIFARLFLQFTEAVAEAVHTQPTEGKR